MKIGKKYRLIKEEEYLGLKADSKNWKERSAIIKDNDIQKEKERLEKKYKKYIGNYYESEDGIVFMIDGIYYSSHSYSWNKFKFSTRAPNQPEWYWEVDFDDIIEGKYGEPIKNPVLV